MIRDGQDAIARLLDRPGWIGHVMVFEESLTVEAMRLLDQRIVTSTGPGHALCAGRVTIPVSAVASLMAQSVLAQIDEIEQAEQAAEALS